MWEANGFDSESIDLFLPLQEQTIMVISNGPEYLVDEVRAIYGVEIPLEVAMTYLQEDPYLIPESLYDYVSRYSIEE
ncbi:MAG: hypothetical protein K2N13_05660 [Paraprevotella sp.]|nr:hypothetical protein [Paraprevotella sp.]